MLPYLFAAAHQNYSTWITQHLRDMQHLPATAKDDLLAGSHVCYHSDGAAAVSGDMFGEQTCIKQGSRRHERHLHQPWAGRSVDPMFRHVFPSLQVIGWDDTETMMLKSWKRLWSPTDTKKRLWEYYGKTLTTETATPYHIINGQVVDGKVNGQDMSTLFSSSLPGGFHAPISNKVVTMKFKTKGVKVNGKIICDLVVNCLLGCWWWGAREEWSFLPSLTTSSARSLHPSSMSMGASETVTSMWLLSVLESLFPISTHQTLYSLMHCSSSTTWCGHRQALWLTSQPAWGTGLIATSPKYLLSYLYRYDKVTAKDHESQRRAGESLTKYQLSLTTPLPSHDKVMKDKTDKQRLGELLCTHNIGDHIEMVSRADSIVTHDKADVSLI